MDRGVAPSRKKVISQIISQDDNIKLLRNYF